MKKIYPLLFFFTLPIVAQVGIKTTLPTADLDVNGTLRIRATTTNPNESAAKDSILVADNLGNVNRISSKKIIESHLKTFVKGAFLSSGDVSLTLSSNTKKIPFDYEEIDTNTEFDTSTSTFTAKQDGIYQVSVQIKATAAIAIATDFGVTILKNGTVINRNSFANVGVVGVNITPPLRTVQTLVALETGNTISFNVVSNLASLGLVGTREDCFFTIHQVR